MKTKNPNIEIEFRYPFKDVFEDKTQPKQAEYITTSTDDLSMPTLGFDNEIDAELVVAMARAMKAHGQTHPDDIFRNVRYMFRVLGFTDSTWAK